MNISYAEKREKVLSGTVVYFIGNVLTQIISILFLKFITSSLSTDEYGYFNLIVTIDNLITPIFTLQISDAVFRFFIKANNNAERKYIFSTGTTIIIIGAIIISVMIIGLADILNIKYPFLVLLYSISTNIFSYLQKVVRSLGQNKLYIIANIIKAIIYLLIMIIFVVILKKGVEGLLLANCISTYLCIAFLIIKSKSYNYYNYKNISYSWLKKLIVFSAPLIPNTAVWWMHSSINSIIISAQIGIGYNGIYSASMKFASILNLVITVFNLSWQESAIREYGSNDYKVFTTNIFNNYIEFLLSFVAIIIPILRIVTPYLIDSNYYEAIQFIPFLLLTTVFTAFSSFFGQMITAKNRNIKLLTTNLIGAITNIVLVLLLVNKIFLWGIVIAVFVTNLFLSISRFIEIKDDFNIKGIQFYKHLSILIICFIQCYIYNCNNFIITIISLIVVSILCFYLNKKIIFELFILLQRKIKNSNY